MGTTENYEAQAEEQSTVMITEAGSLKITADKLIIDSPEMLQFASDQLKITKEFIKAGDEKRKNITRPMDEAKKNVMSFFNEGLEPFAKIKTMIEGKMLTYTSEQETIRKAAEEKARKEQEELQRKADAEAAEKKRVADEAEAEAKKSGDADAMEAAAELQDDADDAADTAEAASMAPAPVVEKQTVKGSNVRKTYAAEVTDLMALAKGVVAGTVPITCIKADQTALNGMARAMKEAMKYPGVRLVTKRSVASR